MRSRQGSNNDSTYTGVPPLSLGACQKFQPGPTKAILGVEPPTPNKKLFDSSMGMPLFWQERKNTEFWGADSARS